MRIFLWVILCLCVVDVIGHAYYAGCGERIKTAAQSWVDCFFALSLVAWATYLLVTA